MSNMQHNLITWIEASIGNDYEDEDVRQENMQKYHDALVSYNIFKEFAYEMFMESMEGKINDEYLINEIWDDICDADKKDGLRMVYVATSDCLKDISL